MILSGVEKRAKDARAAVNRLRHEIDYAAAQRAAGEPVPYNDDIGVALLPIAELLGICVNIAAALDAHLRDSGEPLDDVFGGERERFEGLLAHYRKYHETAR